MNVNEVLTDDLPKDVLYEMSNYQSKVTGLPNNIVLWVRTDLSDYGHSRYRVKIKKDKVWAGIYTVGNEPEVIKDMRNNKLSNYEDKEIKNFIKQFSSLIISLIDEKIDSADFADEVRKIRGT